MTEREPRREFERYDRPRDEVLHDLAINGWATRSSGDIRCKTGWFAEMHNTPAEIAELVDVSYDTIEGAELDEATELIGDFLIIEHADGKVDVLDGKERAIHALYSLYEMQYSVWLEHNE